MYCILAILSDILYMHYLTARLQIEALVVDSLDGNDIIDTLFFAIAETIDTWFPRVIDLSPLQTIRRPIEATG